jgi:hypothetical protein
MDMPQLAATAARVGAAPELRAERSTVSVRLLLPLVTPSTAGSPQLATDLRNALVGRDSVTLLLPPGANAAARLDVGGRQIPLPPALRDALLVALNSGTTAASAPSAAAATTALATAPTSTSLPAGSAPPAGAAPALNAAAASLADAGRSWAVAAQTTAAAAGVISGSGATRQVQRARDDALPPALRFTQPLFEPVNGPSAAQATQRQLRHAIEHSGLFFESHVAQWARGERPAGELGAELRAELRAPSQLTGEGGAQRVAAQVALLQEGVMRLEGPAWNGQPLVLQIGREPDGPAGTDADAVFSARLTMHLPLLGEVDVTLRLAGEAVSASVAGSQPQTLAAALPALADQLAARGLRPVRMSVAPAEVH